MTSIDRVPTTNRPAADDDAGDWALRRAATLFVVVVLLHGADHLRRGVDAAGLDVFWLGTSGITIEVAVVVLIAMRHRLAPLAAMSIGLSLAAGYLAVHFLPARSLFSDSFTSARDVSLLSWTAASLEVIAAVTLGVVGLLVVRRRGGLAHATAPHAAQRPLAVALRDPLSVVMIAGNLALVVVSAFQY